MKVNWTELGEFLRFFAGFMLVVLVPTSVIVAVTIWHPILGGVVGLCVLAGGVVLAHTERR